MSLLTLTGEKLLDIAADKVRHFVQKHNPRRLYVSFSAGKDSTAALAATVYAGDSIVKRVVVVYNEVYGNTHRLNIEQMRRVLEKLGLPEPVVVETPPCRRVTYAVRQGHRCIHIRARTRENTDFWGGVVKWGIPVILADGRRWCYNEFKDKQWRYLPPERVDKRYIIVGVKITDSHWRAKRWKDADPETWSKLFTWRENGGTRVFDYACSPVLKFNNDMVWQVLEEAGLKKELVTYELCEDSLNCFFCPLRSREKQKRIIEKMIVELHDDNAIKIALRALRALRVVQQEVGKPKIVTRIRSDANKTLTLRKALEWIQLIEDALRKAGVKAEV